MNKSWCWGSVGLGWGLGFWGGVEVGHAYLVYLSQVLLSPYNFSPLKVGQGQGQGQGQVK